ncbi:hypothetical protein GF318_05885 [Candidatus Micrarchaeota archaeon]|nr:hypothetical protein [Candidatus Micrarchaeota archaeon]
MAGPSARITLSNGRLVIVITGGGRDPRRYTYERGDRITGDTSREEITNMVRRAIIYGGARAARESRPDARAVDALRNTAPAIAGRVHSRLHRTETREEPAPAPREAEPERPARPRRRRARPAAPRRRRRQPRRRRERPAEARPPRPTITAEWIQSQLRAARGSDADRPATALHANREFVQQFLSSQAHQRAAVAAVFNELYRTRRFQLWLGSVAGREGREYTLLQAHLREQGDNPRLAPDADESLLRTAASTIRFYVLEFEANRDEYSRLRSELRQLPSMRSRLGNNSRLQSYRSGPIDADTITAAVLYLRRLHLDSTEGRARRQAGISVWRAPSVRETEEGEREQPEEQEEEAEQTPLQQFAAREWTNLPAELYRSARQGRPEAVGTLLRNLPDGYDSIEDALQELNRTDVRDAFDRIFNEFLHHDRAFRAFCQSSPSYRRVAHARVHLDSDSPPGSRRLVARAVQAFINFSAARTDEEWCGRLNQDLNILYRNVLGTQDTSIGVDGVADMRTIAALSVYTWRRTHHNAAVGEWARNIPRVTIPEEPVTAPTERREDRGGRRRVLTLPAQ